MVVHRPTLKKKQKGFKSRHSTKGSIKEVNKGRVAKNNGNGLGSKPHNLSKQERRNMANQIMANKVASVAERTRIFDGRHGVPRNVAVIPLTPDIDSTEVVNKFCGELEAQMDAQENGIVWIPRFRQRLRFWIPRFDSFWDVLDAARAADFVVFVLSAGTEIDDRGEQIVRCIGAQGVTTSLGTVWGLEVPENSPKKQSQLRESLTSWFGHFFSGERLYSLGVTSEVVVAARNLCQRAPKGVHWRDERSWVVADSLTATPEGLVQARGFLRGQSMAADQLVHIPGVGDLRIERLDVDKQEPPPLLPSREDTSLDPLCDTAIELHDPEDSEHLEGAGVRVDGHTYLTELVEQGMEGAPQTIQRLPKGVSDYQASWMLEGEDYGFSDSDFDHSEEMEDADEEGELVDAQGNAKEAEEEDMEVEDDELDTDGLQKFREAQEDLEFPDEIELEPTESGRERLHRYRGVQNLRHCEWDANEADPRAPEIFPRLWRPGPLGPAGNRVTKELNTETKAPLGSVVTLYLSGTAEVLAALDRISTKGMAAVPIVLYSLLPGEQRWGVVSMSVTPDSEMTEPVKSKEPLIVQVGPRRLEIRPLFSQAGHTDNGVYKFHRYLHPGRSATATVIAPVMLASNTPVVYFTPKPMAEGRRIMGTGSVLDADAQRVIVKTAVLTGYPVKIHRKLVTVRYMFFNRDDVQWFKAVPLFTKHGAQGLIKEPLGTHGYFKCTFDRRIRANDTVAMALYKRVWPKPSSVWQEY